MGMKYSKGIALSLFMSLNLFAQESFSLKQQSLEATIKKIAHQAKMPYVVDGKFLKGKFSKEIKNIQ